MAPTGDDDPCPCGSGLLYGRCCGAAQFPMVIDFNIPEEAATEGGEPRGKILQLKPQGPEPEPLEFMGPDEVDLMVDHLKQAAERIQAELGISMRIASASFNDYNATIRIEAATVREDGVVMDREAESFLKRCEDFGFEQTDLGREFTFEGRRFRVVGLQPRATKHPVVCQEHRPGEAEDALVRMSAAMVRNCLQA